LSGENLIERRKNEHLLIALEEEVEYRRKSSFLEFVELIHEALPEISLSDVSTQVEVWGFELEAPLVIAGMTGGSRLAERVNRALARAAAEVGLALGVGSQRAGIERPELKRTYEVVKEYSSKVPVIANIGISQVVNGLSREDALELVEMVNAAALAVHLNPLQEAVQPEGETELRGSVRALNRLVRESPVPVIAKETGAGVSKETAAKLIGAGVAGIDVGGAGGTNFALIEGLRALTRGDEEGWELAKTFSGWGIPTAASILEVRSVSSSILLIATGGIRSGVDVAKAFRLGADLCGVALPALRALFYLGYEGLVKLLKRYVRELKIALFLTGSATLSELREKPVVVLGPLREWIEARKLKVP